MLSNKELQETICLLDDNIELWQKPDANNNIVLENNVMYMIKNGIVIRTVEFDHDNFKQMVECVNDYNKNPFSSKYICYSPLDADRYKKYWNKQYKIDFPNFMAVFLAILLVTKRVPNCSDCINVALNTYTEIVPENEMINRAPFYNKIYNDRENINLWVGSKEIGYAINEVRRFKEKYLPYCTGIPFNEFTVEQYSNRIFKTYGSGVRDIYLPIRSTKYDLKVFYSWMADFGGIDCIINDSIPGYGIVNSRSASYFIKDKQLYRHYHLDQTIGIVLAANAIGKNGLFVIPDEKIIEVKDTVLNKEITSFVKIIY